MNILLNFGQEVQLWKFKWQNWKCWHTPLLYYDVYFVDSVTCFVTYYLFVDIMFLLIFWYQSEIQIYNRGPSWSWSYGSWIYIYLCNQCLLPLRLYVRTLFMVRCTWYNIIKFVSFLPLAVFSGYTGRSAFKNNCHMVLDKMATCFKYIVFVISHRYGQWIFYHTKKMKLMRQWSNI